MNLSDIYNLFKKEINHIKNNRVSKERIHNQNKLIMALTEKLIIHYESSNYSEVIGFKINRRGIDSYHIINQDDFNKQSYDSDLFTIFIGPFSIINEKFVMDSEFHVLAESSSCCFYAKLYPFDVIVNTLKKESNVS